MRTTSAGEASALTPGQRRTSDSGRALRLFWEAEDYAHTRVGSRVCAGLEFRVGMLLVI